MHAILCLAGRMAALIVFSAALVLVAIIEVLQP